MNGASPAVALIGTGAIAQEFVEIFGAACFVGAYCDPAYAATARVALPVYTCMRQLRGVASHFIIGLADPAHRARLAREAERNGLVAAPPLVASTAYVSPTASVGDGSVLTHGVQIGANARLGEHNFLMHHTVFGHDTRSGSHVVLGPAVQVAGEVIFGDGVIARAGATLAKGITVGDYALIAQSAACFRSVPAHSTVIGNPARVARREQEGF